MAPKGGIEPPTKRLTVSCATATLLRNKLYFWKHTYQSVPLGRPLKCAFKNINAEIIRFIQVPQVL